MRNVIVGLSAIGFALSVMGAMDMAAAAKAPAKTKLGCVVGKEKWDAGTGKCVAAKPVAKANKKA